MRSMTALRLTTDEHSPRETRRGPRPAAAVPRETPPPPGRGWSKPALFVLALVVVIWGSVRAAASLTTHLGTVETDDAQVEGQIAPVLPRLAGQVREVLVRDNEMVRAGQAVARLDDRELQAKYRMAHAALASAQAALAMTEANVKVADAARVRASADLARYKQLVGGRDVPQQQYDAARATAQAADAQYTAAVQQVAAAQAQVAQRRSDLEFSLIQISYTILTAPIAGAVTKKAVEVGQFVQPGQSLMAIAQHGEVWVVANFKETQLARMRVAQPVTLLVDAYPGVELTGRIESLAPNTGARLSLFPADNATGNFTKVVQRVPVKILLDNPTRADAPLRIGMSVTARVKVG